MDGIIPACAGNSLHTLAWQTNTRDHPRVCGEQERSCLLFAMALGSSPRVRGTECMDDIDEVGQGIIPACAGNSKSNTRSCYALWDHPRVCGEQVSLSGSGKWTWGSSPRVRGTVPTTA